MNKTLYVLGLRGLTMFEKGVLLFLLGHQGRAPCSVPVATLAACLSCSVRTVQRALARLAAGRYLTRAERDGRTSLYRIGPRLAGRLTVERRAT